MKNLLDIFLITYNRKNHLQETFNQIFANNSPIKDFPITIIDNASTDGTSELIQEYAKKFPNITHIKHNRNIGGNANIARAFEQASKEYFWILCDNDNYNWAAWNDVANAIKNKSDAIFVSTFNWPDVDIAHAFVQATFVPGVIYKTNNINDTVMENIEYNISNLFPHTALFAHLLNNNKKITVLKKSIVIIGTNEDNALTRGNEVSELHHIRQRMNWYVGYANTLHLVKNKSLRNYIATNRKNSPAINSIDVILSNKHSLHNLFCIFYVLSFRQKILFLIKYILTVLPFFIIQIHTLYYRNLNADYFKRTKIKLFNFININLKKVPIKREQNKNKYFNIEVLN